MTARRINVKDVQNLLDAVNRSEGFDPETVKYNTVGALILDRAYGGTRIVRVCNEYGGVSAVTHGYGTLREAETFMQGYLAKAAER